MNIVIRLASILANTENMGMEVYDVLEDAIPEIKRLEREVEDLRFFLRSVSINCAERAKDHHRR